MPFSQDLNQAGAPSLNLFDTSAASQLKTAPNDLILVQGGADRFRLSESSTAAEMDSLALPEDPDEGPLLITSASPVRPLHNACTAESVPMASSQAAQQLRLSGSGQGMMTVVRTQFVPLSDSLSDSDSDSEVSVASCTQIMKVPASKLRWHC